MAAVAPSQHVPSGMASACSPLLSVCADKWDTEKGQFTVSLHRSPCTCKNGPAVRGSAFTSSLVGVTVLEKAARVALRRGCRSI